MQWLRRRFIAGFFVTVPVIASVAALVWIFRVVDGFTAPIYARLLGREVPGLGLLTTAVAVLARRRGRHQRHRPAAAAARRSTGCCCAGLQTVYAPVKQLVLAFSPDNEYGFKQVVLVEDARARLRAWGF